MKLPNRNGGLYHNGGLGTYLTNYGKYSKTILAHGNGWQVVKEVNTVINATDYYKYILISNNGTISVEIQTLDGTSLFTSSWSTSVSSQQFNILCQDPNSTNQQILIKEIKIKEL